MRIEALENIKSDGYVVTASDILTVDDAAGLKWIRLGWASDPTGVIPTGERIVVNAQLMTQNVEVTNG